MPRLLVCKTCPSIEVIPDDYDGPPEYDYLLNALLAGPKHKFPDGTAHFGLLHRIDQKSFDSIMRQTDGSGMRQLSAELFKNHDLVVEWRDTFREDANACFNRHGRPKMGCIDYCDSSRRIGNPSTAERRNFTVDSKPPPPVYLCHFCPVHSGFVLTERRHAAGLYRPGA